MYMRALVKKQCFWIGKTLVVPKSTFFPAGLLACTWGDFRFYEKIVLFLVVLSGCGRFWAFSGEPAEISWPFWGHLWNTCLGRKHNTAP